MELFKHEHPLKLIDLQPLYPNYEVVYSDDDHDDDDEKEVLIPKQDFRCLCDGCGEEINYFHRYYYSCDQCNFSLHKFCGSKIPETLSLPSHPLNTLTFSHVQYYCRCYICNITEGVHFYSCLQCPFDIDLGCVAKERVKCETIYHPSHRHPLMPIHQQIKAKCYACGKKHEGIFYQCTICDGRSLLHSNCVFQPNKLLTIQHPHPLTLAYSFPKEEQITKHFPRCRLCDHSFGGHEHHWIYKCEDCRYYAHLDCVTSRKEPKSGMVKNFEDADYSDLLHLPFLDETGSILKHFLFFKQKESSREHDETNGINIPNLHKHPLIQVDRQRTMLTSSGISSCHDPMKSVQLLCNGCVRPITSMPFYKCAYDHEDHRCNFVLHEWCTRLPCELKHHPCHHPQHTLVLVPRVPWNSLDLFYCDVCKLHCNGFAYSCVDCKSYYIDVTCAFIPKHVTHEAHSNYLLSIFNRAHLNIKHVTHHLLSIFNRAHLKIYLCRLCTSPLYDFSYSCQECDIHLHPSCALLLPKTIRHKFDKHPMKLSYIPIENHKSDYFCEVCEEEFDPTRAFYHCHECGWSIHSACAPLILQCERNTYSERRYGVYEYVNIKFGGIHKIEDHPHPLKFLQGIQSDGQCSALHCARARSYNYDRTLQYKLILNCLRCKFAVHYAQCCKIMNDID